jgi:hypothetical protein
MGHLKVWSQGKRAILCRGGPIARFQQYLKKINMMTTIKDLFTKSGNVTQSGMVNYPEWKNNNK